MTRNQDSGGWGCILVLASVSGLFALGYVIDAALGDDSWPSVGQHVAFMAVFLVIASAIVWLRRRRRR